MTKDEAMKMALDALLESRDVVSEAVASAKELTGRPTTDRRHQYLVEQLARHNVAIVELRYALTVGNPALPPGWVAVPVDPTPEMHAEMSAYDGTSYSNPFDEDDFRANYTAMLAAAPMVTP
jgi:hypothetical protein